MSHITESTTQHNTTYASTWHTAASRTLEENNKPEAKCDVNL